LRAFSEKAGQPLFVGISSSLAQMSVLSNLCGKGETPIQIDFCWFFWIPYQGSSMPGMAALNASSGL
jgi:hypothetical protein